VSARDAVLDGSAVITISRPIVAAFVAVVLSRSCPYRRLGHGRAGGGSLQENRPLKGPGEMNDQADTGPHTNTGQTLAGTYRMNPGSDGAAPDARSAETSPM